MRVLLTFLLITLAAVRASYEQRQFTMTDIHECATEEYGANCDDPLTKREFCFHKSDGIPSSVCAPIAVLPFLFKDGDYCGRCTDTRATETEDGSTGGLQDDSAGIPIFDNSPTSSPVSVAAPVAPATSGPSGSSLPSMFPSLVPSAVPSGVFPTGVPSGLPSGSYLPSEVPTIDEGSIDTDAPTAASGNTSPSRGVELPSLAPVLVPTTTAPVGEPTRTIPDFILPTNTPLTPPEPTETYFGTAVEAMYTLGPLFTKDILSDAELTVIEAEVMEVINKNIPISERATIVYNVSVQDQSTVSEPGRRLLRHNQRKLQEDVKEILLLLDIQGYVHPDAGGDYNFFNVIFLAIEGNLLDLQTGLRNEGIIVEYEECKLQGPC